MNSFRKFNLMLCAAAFTLTSFNASAAIIDASASVVQLRSPASGGGTEAGTTLNNCFTKMTDLVNWISTTRLPSAAKPLQVNVGPGQFTGFSCSNGGYTSLRGAGRTNTTIGGSTDYFGVSVTNCTQLDFQDLKVTHKTNAFNTIVWFGPGTSTWNNVDVIGGSYAWVDGDLTGHADSCSLAGRSTHYWFGSRITATTDVGLTKGYISQCSASWFYGTEINASVTTSGSAISIALSVANNLSEAHVYGGAIRATAPAGVTVTGTLGAVEAKDGGMVHIHGTGIDLNSVEPNSVVALSASNTGMIHANETAYNLSTGAGGTVTRISNNGGHIHAPYLWEHVPDPTTIPNFTSVTGADMAPIATGTSDGHPHFAIYDASCSSKWFDTVDKVCKP